MFYQFQHFGLSDYLCKEYGKDFNFPIHLHNSFELITVIAGEMEVCIEDKIYTVHPNEAVLIFPNQLHSLTSIHCQHMLCIFSPDIVSSFFNQYHDKIPTTNKFNLDKFYFDKLKMIDENSPAFNKKGLFYSICSSFHEQVVYTDSNNDDKNLLYQIFRFVEQNFADDCSLKALARATTYSYSYISRYFKEIAKMSFHSYVNQYRISNACYIFENTNCSTLECSIECGYRCLRSFNRNFKEITGITPLEYKKQIKGSVLS